jgi:hypothetical protein
MRRKLNWTLFGMDVYEDDELTDEINLIKLGGPLMTTNQNEETDVYIRNGLIVIRGGLSEDPALEIDADNAEVLACKLLVLVKKLRE